MYELTFMTCRTCHEEGLVDSYQRDADWSLDLDLDLDADACSCGQKFVVVFTARLGRSGGADAQTWCCLPLSNGELEALEAAARTELPGLVSALGENRRFLVRSTDVCGRESGFVIGPHD